MIENNIHCFIEKPITRSYNEAQQLLKLAAEHNVLIQVGHVERFNPALIALRNEKLILFLLKCIALANLNHVLLMSRLLLI